MDEIAIAWQKKWDSAGVFEPAVSSKPKFYLTAAFPYPNSPQHIGHARTYTTTDIYARYKRMKGYNVLFPMGFHVTGTPILAMAKRIAQKDPDILGVFQDIYGISNETAATLTDPIALVMHFSNEIEMGMKEIGFSIDWRRKFYSNDPAFNRFIEWQFRLLEKKGYIKKGSHPVPWCPSDNNSVSAHDTKGDVDPTLEEVTLVKFPCAAGGFFIASTYRPETIYGVTNIWANPSAKYSKVSFGGAEYYISSAQVEYFKNQFADLRALGELDFKALSGMKVSNPLTGAPLPIVPATFVDPAHGTGIVMSVPAHAPYDYLALRDANLPGINMINVIALAGFGAFPAKEIADQMGVKDQNDPKAEEATKEIYRKEAHEGVMAIGKFKGMKVSIAKDKVKEDLMSQGFALKFHEIANSPVFCRCGARIVVKNVIGQWFIDYGDPEWKKLAHECLGAMAVLPEKSKGDLNYTLDWLQKKACSRAQGLGTKLPFDQSQIIESLSDSTIYMAFYTIAHIARKMPVEMLNDDFFNYAFFGTPLPSGQKPNSEMEAARKEFSYWYPLDSRHSGADLIYNHLAFFIFNHVAIFPRGNWPRQIVANGFVTMDGKKMSKSMGNILPLRKAIVQYGADVVRFSVVNGAELKEDSDFSQTAANGVSTRLRQFSALLGMACKEKPGATDNSLAYRWLMSRLHSRIAQSESLYESLSLRELGQELFFNTSNDLAWYMKRSQNPRLSEFFKLWIPAVAPIMPHIAEEFNVLLNGEKAGLVSTSAFPQADKGMIDTALELMEEQVVNAKFDIEHILEILKMPGKPKSITLFAASEWKYSLKSIVAKERNPSAAIKAAMAVPELKKHGAEVPKIVASYMKNIGSLDSSMLGRGKEIEALKDACAFYSAEFGCPVTLALEEEASPEQAAKAKNAMPGKAAILVAV